MRRFTRTPYYTGPEDPERAQIRGTLAIGETAIIETVGGHDQDLSVEGELKSGMVMEVKDPRGSREGGPFYIDGIEPGDWVSIEILDVEVGPYGFYRNGGPFWGSIRLIAPVRDGMVHFPPDFIVPVRPMVGVIQLASVAPFEIDHGGNMDFNSVRPGSTVHIRAQKPGGLLTLGDVHARMSDGELTGTGVEIDSAVTVRISRSSGFSTSSPVVETTNVAESPEEFLTSGRGATWPDAIRAAWADMVSLIADVYSTTMEHANLIVGTIGDARPGYSAGDMNRRGYQGSGYVTAQIAVTKDLRRTGMPFVAEDKS